MCGAQTVQGDLAYILCMNGVDVRTHVHVHVSAWRTYGRVDVLVMMTGLSYDDWINTHFVVNQLSHGPISALEDVNISFFLRVYIIGDKEGYCVSFFESLRASGYSPEL